jgi:hypothetical protein
VRVPIFKNETLVRGLEFELTEEVIKQIELKTPWKVVQSESADAVLTGKVIALSKRTVLHNELNEARESELTLAVEIDFKDLRAAGAQVDPLAEPLPAVPPTTSPLPDDEPALFGLRRGGKRLGGLGRRAPNLVEAQAPFIPELGESIATARQRAARDLANQIVGMLEVPW